MATEEKQRLARETCSVEEAAQRLGMGINQAYAAIKANQIAHLKFGQKRKSIKVITAALDRMLAGE
jgi:excisionase family DNA binding protein